MLKQLERKLDEMQIQMFANFNSYTSIDFLEVDENGNPLIVERDGIMLDKLVNGYREWLADNKTLFDMQDKDYGFMVDLYFKKDKEPFAEALLETMTNNAVTLFPREQTMYVNALARAIITRYINLKVSGRIIDLSSNS